MESECTGCEGGQFCPGYGNINPAANCSAGYYCVRNASTSTPSDGTTGDVCPIGYYCPEGTAIPKQCEPGTYTDTTQNSQCLPCTAGRYCITGTSPDPCPMGYYCPEGTGHVWQSCPVGTFSGLTGLANETQCTPCTGGSYCAYLNATTVSGPCDAGYYCSLGSKSQTPSGATAGTAAPCPVGHYCPQQTDFPIACPAGTFNNQTKRTMLSDCQACLEGYYCDEHGLEFPKGLCQQGFYCSGGSNSSQPIDQGAVGGVCWPGTYCPTGTGWPIECVAGTYNPIGQQAACLDCPQGYHCVAGSYNITDCPKGQWFIYKSLGSKCSMCILILFSTAIVKSYYTRVSTLSGKPCILYFILPGLQKAWKFLKSMKNLLKKYSIPILASF